MDETKFYMFQVVPEGAKLSGSSHSLSFIRQMGEAAASLGREFFVYEGSVEEGKAWKVGGIYKCSGSLPTSEAAV